MLTEQDLAQIASLISANNQQIEAMMNNKIQVQKQDIITQMVEAMSEQTEVLTKMVNDAETRINIKIGNEVCKRIDTLFDGYKLTHKKQYELEHKVDRLENEIDNIRNILAIAGLAG